MLELPDSQTERPPEPAEAALQEALSTIAALEQTVRQRELRLLESSAAATAMEVRLADAQEESERLKKRVTAVTKASEFLAAKIPPPVQDANTGEKLIHESEVLRLKEQWRATQRMLEKEQDRLRGELVKASGAWQRSNHQLEIQTRAHRAEVDRSQSRVATLERQVASASASAASQVADKGRGMWIKLSATSAGTAVIIVLAGLWFQFAPASRPSAVKAAAVPVDNNRTEVSPVHAVTAVLNSPIPMQSPGLPSGQFQKALSRLNDALSVAGSASPEQLLRAVRKANAKTDPGVCNIQWNNGQPALTFGGSLSMEASLERCANAVDRYLKN